MYGRKKQIMAGLLALFIFLTFRGVFADDTCGTNVKFTISGSTISFAKGDGTEDPKWEDGAGSNCGAVFREDTEITSVKVTEKISVTDGSLLFEGFGHVREMDLSKLDVSAVTDMSYMFLDCGSLTSLDLSGWDTSSVTNMNSMFRECGSLESLDLSGWDTSKVTNMSGMFLECGSLSSVDVSGWNTSGVVYMANMFDGCSYLESLDVSGWDTSGVEYMGGMFHGCGSLTSLDVSGWNTSSVIDMQGMFYDCGSLSSVDVSGWNTSSVTDMNSMFYDCGSLSSVDVSGWNTSSVTDMHYMFYDCGSLSSLDISGWDTSSVTDMSYMFLNCGSLQTLALGKNTVGKNIFESLPSRIYNSKWYYLQTGAAAEDPLPLNTGKNGDKLFGAYDSGQMAGVWSTDPDLVLAADITIEYPAGTVITGETVPVHSTEVQLTASASASQDGAGQKFFWHSRDPKTASVDADGNVTFKKAGKVTITVKAADCSRVYAVTTLTYGLAEAVKILDPDGKDITGGAETIDTTEYQLKAKALPEGVPQEFTWKSSNTAVAAVSEAGKVTFKKAGTVTITAAAADGSEKSAEVTLVLKPDPVYRLDLFRLGEGCQLPATGFPSRLPAALSVQPKELRYSPLRMRLQIPSLDLEAELVTVPLKDDIWHVDWLNDRAGVLDGTALPGEGVSVIAAHNTLNDTNYGPFALLFTLDVNDTVMVSDAKGSVKLFRVYANELLAPDDTEKLASIASREKNTLVLVTCENESAEGGYLNRRAVFAAQK